MQKLFNKLSGYLNKNSLAGQWDLAE